MNDLKLLFQDALVCHSGRVFKARSSESDFLAFETLKSQELVNEEVQIHYSLASAYLKQIAEYVPSLNLDYILYRYVEGHTLQQLISRGVPFSEQSIVQWLFQLLQALHRLHSHKLLARCISTASIKIDAQTNAPVLMDFGFYPDILKENLRCITAPEVVLKQSYDSKIDIWLLGVICYELINL